MYRIAIVGAGRLGARHLQGLGRLTLSAELHIVEPSEAAVTNAKALLAQVSPGANVAPLVVHHEVATLPTQLDLVIIATTSDVRLAALRSVLSHARVGSLVLEKVLFQAPDEYEQARAVLASTNTNTWVNCPRRLYPVYQEIKEMFSADPMLHLDVWGGEWGLGSNAVHFVDLFTFMTGRVPEKADISGLDPGVRPGKRAGFAEFSGAIRGRSGSSSFSLTSTAAGVIKHMVTLRGAKSTAIVDEEGGMFWRIDASGSRLLPTVIPYQSSLTGQVAEQLLTTGACLLPRYDESMGVHLSLLPSLAAHHGGLVCSVT